MSSESTANSSFQHDRRPDAAAQAQAALLLLEAVIHSLLDKGALTKDEVADAFRTAIEVKEESAIHAKEPAAVLKGSIALLRAMAHSVTAHSGLYHGGSADSN